MGETLHVAYKKKYIKRFFSINTKYISSSELKTSEISLVLITRDKFDVSTHSMKYTLRSKSLVFTDEINNTGFYHCQRSSSDKAYIFPS